MVGHGPGLQYSDGLEPITLASNAGGVLKKSRCSTNISFYLGNDMIQDRAIVTTERRQELVLGLSNDAIFNDLE